jgi:hypothetical protein
MPPRDDRPDPMPAGQSLVIAAALFRFERGLYLSPAQEIIVAYHPDGTAGGCPSAPRPRSQ